MYVYTVVLATTGLVIAGHRILAVYVIISRPFVYDEGLPKIDIHSFLRHSNKFGVK